MSIFTDTAAAVSEMSYLADSTGKPHAVVRVMQVVEYDEAIHRDLPVIEMASPRIPTRRSGLRWCPGCAQHVPDSQMKVHEGGGHYAQLERCKRCQSSGRIASERAVGAAHRGGTGSAS